MVQSDAVISMATFEFLDDPQKALNEFFRVVKAGGQVLIGTIAADSDWGDYYRNKHNGISVFKYSHFKTLEEMRGWKPEKLMETGVGSSDYLSEIRHIYEAMDDVCNFTIDVKISNLCGCGK